MKKAILILASCTVAVVAASSLSAPQVKEELYPEESLVLSSQMSERMDWMEKCLAEIRTIKVGAKRKDVRKVFRSDGGLQRLNPQKLVYRRFPYIKVDVDFKVGRDADGRVIRKDDDTITSISKPYLEPPQFG